MLNDELNQYDEVVKLLQDIIRIPSWVSSDPTKQNENALVDYLEKWININTNLITERQKIEGGRYNLIAKKGKPDLVFLAHTDTVQISKNAPYDQLSAEIHDNAIWGRGATDMKSGIASMLHAFKSCPEADNVWFFLYADEEYDFAGMKALVDQFGDIRPKLIVSSDGSDLKVGHGCRGLIEITFRVRGATGHAAKGNGINAIDQTYQILQKMKDLTSNQNHPTMGKTSMNVAFILGGAELSHSIKDNALKEVGSAGNVIPDICECKVDIRPSVTSFTAKKCIEDMQEEANKEGIKLEVVSVTHDLGSWFTDISKIENLDKIVKSVVGEIRTSNPDDTGYIDLQMLWKKTGMPNAFMFGGGLGKTAHTPEERIPIPNLLTERDLFLEILKNYA